MVNPKCLADLPPGVAHPNPLCDLFGLWGQKVENLFEEKQIRWVWIG